MSSKSEDVDKSDNLLGKLLGILPDKMPHMPQKINVIAVEKKELIRSIGNILSQYGGKESDVPITSEYWELLNRYRGM